MFISNLDNVSNVLLCKDFTFNRLFMFSQLMDDIWSWSQSLLIHAWWNLRRAYTCSFCCSLCIEPAVPIRGIGIPFLRSIWSLSIFLLKGRCKVSFCVLAPMWSISRNQSCFNVLYALKLRNWICTVSFVSQVLKNTSVLLCLYYKGSNSPSWFSSIFDELRSCAWGINLVKKVCIYISE